MKEIILLAVSYITICTFSHADRTIKKIGLLFAVPKESNPAQLLPAKSLPAYYYRHVVYGAGLLVFLSRVALHQNIVRFREP